MLFILGLFIGVIIGVVMTAILSVDNIPGDGVFLDDDEKDVTSGK